MRNFALTIAAIALFFSQGAAAVQLKIATAAPENSSWMQDMRAGFARIKEQTDGRVDLKIYGGGIQGSDKKVLQKIKVGQLHGGAFTPGSLADRYGSINLFSLPFVFNSPEEVEYVRERMDATILKGLEDAGFVSFGFSGGGFAVLFSQTPVRTVAELKGKKVWVPEGDPISYAAMKDLGLSPVTLPITDVLTGLQTGLLDIVAVPPVTALVLQWHTKVRYMLKVPILYTMGLMAIDKRAFGRLSEADQQVVRDVMGEVYRKFDEESWQTEEEATVALKNAKIEPVFADEAEMKRIREIINKTNRRLGEERVYSLALYEQMLGHINDFRNNTKAVIEPVSD